MPLPEEFKNHRHLLVAMGTGDYDRLPAYALPGVKAEIETIANIFKELGYERKLTDHSYNPTSDWIRKEIPHFKQELTEKDLLVLYYSGHGHSDIDRFYVLTRDSEENGYDSTAVPAADLARWIGKGSKAKQVLLIIDACYSGAGAFDILQIARGITDNLEQATSIYVITAARPREYAQVGRFAQAFSETLKNQNSQIGGRTQQFLTSDDIMDSLKKNLTNLNKNQVATMSCFNIRERCYLFPNPRFSPGMPVDIDLETQRVFEAHWIPKARGAETAHPGAWYFTGRKRALQELTSWLAGRDQRKGFRVVTGNAGSGKSALLGRVVTLSSPVYRDSIFPGAMKNLDPSTIPPKGVIDAAIHLRHRSLPEVMGQLKTALGIEAADVDELIEGISTRDKTTLVMDALDESQERDKILEKLLKPLGEIPNVKVIVGTRPDSTSTGEERRFKGLGTEAVEIDLDHPDFIGETDIADYVEARLLAKAEPGRITPYTGKPGIAQAVAAAVAEKANHNFLAAYTASQWLLSREEPMNIDVPGWIQGIPLGLRDTFDEFLKQIAVKTDRRLSADKARAVLSTLAFSEGSGIPWSDVLGPVAEAINRVPVNDQDIHLVFQHAAAFVIEALENERSVYRIFHEDLAGYLRIGFDEKEVHGRISAALQEKVPRIQETGLPDWSMAHPYVLSHLAAHALKGGDLGELSRDLHFLGSADPERLASALNRATDDLSTASRQIFNSTWAEIFDSTWADIVYVPPPERIAYQQLNTFKWNLQNSYKRFEEWATYQPWKVRWANWYQPGTPHKVLKKNIGIICLALAEIKGKTVIAAGCEDGTIQILNPETGKLIREPFTWHKKEINSVAVGMLGQKPLIVSGSDDQTIRVWDLETGQPIGEPLKGHKNSVISVTVGMLNEKPLIVSGSDDQTIRVWDLETGKHFGKPLKGHKNSVTSVAVGMLNEKPLIVSGSRDKTIRVWDLGTGKPFGEILKGHENSATLVAIGMLGQKPLIVSGGRDKTIRVWDLETGKPFGETLKGHESDINSVAVGVLNQKPLIVSGSFDQTIRVWDLETGKPIGEPLKGHESPVNSVAVGMLGQQPLIVSGGRDKTIRVWDLETGKPFGKPLKRHKDYINSVAVGMLGQKPLIVSGSFDQTIRVWDLETGKPSGEPLIGHEGHINSVAVAMLGQKPLIVSGSTDKTIRVWDLETGKPFGELLIGHESYINSIAIGILNKKPLIVSGSGDKAIRVWDLETGKPFGEPLIGHENSVTSVAVGMLGQKTLIVSGSSDETIRVWDLETGKPFGKLLKGNKESVSSVAVGMLGQKSVIVSGNIVGTIQVWDLETGKSLGEPLKGHEWGISSIAVGMLNQKPLMVSGGYDNTIRVWDMENRRSKTIQIGSWCNSVAIFAGSTIIVGTASGIVVLEINDHTWDDAEEFEWNPKLDSP